MAIVKTKNLTKEYGQGKNKVIALGGVDLSVESGEIVVITGASGSGKSTLLHLLGGLDRPTKGTVFYDDTDIYKLNDSKLSELRLTGIGFVFQFFNLIPELTAKENIILPLLLNGKKADERHILKIAEMLGITERLSHFPAQMSGGQQQRVAIARALSNDPDVILCDEPTGNLDEKSGKEVIELLESANKEFGKTVIIVTHNPSIAAEAERCVRLSDGSVVEDERKE